MFHHHKMTLTLTKIIKKSFKKKHKIQRGGKNIKRVITIFITIRIIRIYKKNHEKEQIFFFVKTKRELVHVMALHCY